MREAIVAALGALPETYRQIVILRDINGLSYYEIGEILEIEEGTVKSRLSRARENLRKVLILGGNYFNKKSSNYAERRRDA
jgi:RNA polymerase sigma-70 factor (ECF subfamily)